MSWLVILTWSHSFNINVDFFSQISVKESPMILSPLFEKTSGAPKMTMQDFIKNFDGKWRYILGSSECKCIDTIRWKNLLCQRQVQPCWIFDILHIFQQPFLSYKQLLYHVTFFNCFSVVSYNAWPNFLTNFTILEGFFLFRENRFKY